MAFVTGKLTFDVETIDAKALPSGKELFKISVEEFKGKVTVWDRPIIDAIAEINGGTIETLYDEKEREYKGRMYPDITIKGVRISGEWVGKAPFAKKPVPSAPKAVSKVPSPVAAKAVTANKTEDGREKNINRAVALKAGVELVCALSGMMKGVKGADAVKAVLEYASDFERYLNGDTAKPAPVPAPEPEAVEEEESIPF